MIVVVVVDVIEMLIASVDVRVVVEEEVDNVVGVGVVVGNIELSVKTVDLPVIEVVTVGGPVVVVVT